MKVISLLNPWAQLIAIGAKKIETRSWATKYRGPIAIHASKSKKAKNMNLAWEDPFWSALKPCLSEDPDELSIKYHPGCIIAYGNLVDCIEIRKSIEGIIRLYGETGKYLVPLWSDEYQFGDYAAGRYAWIFEDIRMLPEPIPAKGRLGIWEYDGEITAKALQGEGK